MNEQKSLLLDVYSRKSLTRLLSEISYLIQAPLFLLDTRREILAMAGLDDADCMQIHKSGFFKFKYF